MKKDEIIVGQTYRATVSGKVTSVRVDAIRTVEGYRRAGYGQKKSPDRTAYECTNLTTNRQVSFKSAMKFQRVVSKAEMYAVETDSAITKIQKKMATEDENEIHRQRVPRSVDTVTNLGLITYKITTTEGENSSDNDAKDITDVAEKDIERFETKFKKGDVNECWNWLGPSHRSGYGQFKFGERVVGAHRLSYVIYHGPVIDGLHVLHECDNRVCVNPKHLFLGTNRDNILDRNAKGRGNIVHGESSNFSKLTEEQVNDIRNRYVRKNHSCSNALELANEFGVTKRAIALILDGSTWKRSLNVQQTDTVDSFASRFRSKTTQSTTGGLTPTAEQEAILAAVQRDDHVIVVEAGAGTGKTSTLKMIGQTLPGNGQYTAFNSSLVAESKSKFAGSSVTCNTTHSLAFRAEGVRFAHRLGGNRVRGDQLAEMLGITAMEVPFGSVSKRLAAGFLASQVMGAIRRFCQSADPVVTVDHFKYIDGIDMPSDEGRRGYASNGLVRNYLLSFARRAWKDLSDPKGTLPFNHDCYVKVWQLNNPVISADYILVDESQDSAPVFLDVLKQQQCKIIFVGDSAQQIYEWRGAVNAMADFPDAPRCFLSQSFRFGPAIAEVANAVLATLEEPTKLRLKGFDKIPSTVGPIENPTAILTRTNAVAVASLLSAIADGKKPFLIGGGADTIAFVEAAQKLQNGEPTSHPDLCCFGSWGEVQEYVKQEEGADLQLMVKIIDEFKAATILTALRAMPAKEEDADLVISTAHKSKGREWERVKLAADFPTKSKCCDSDRKLLYVALTRAKLQLDVSVCPFFTGQDSLDIKSIRDKYYSSSAVQSTQGVVPEVPSAPPAPTQFTWANKDGKWLIRGMKGQVGKEVSVVRKDGSSQKKKLVAVVQEFESAALYRA